MSEVVIALITCIGTWATLRGHPAYHGHAILQRVGGVLLLIAGGACIMPLAIGVTLHQPVAVQIAAVFGALVLMGFGMAIGASALGTSPDTGLNTCLPPHIRAVTLHRQSLRRWSLATLAFFVVCALLALMPGLARNIAIALGAPVGVLAAVGAPGLYLKAMRLDRAVTALEHDPWLHWRYTPEARTAWINVQLQRVPPAGVPSRAWRVVACVCVAVFVSALLFLEGSPLFRAGCGLGSAALVIGIVEATLREARRLPQRLEQRLRAAEPDAYFGHDGVVCDARFLTWLSPTQYLVSATVDLRAPRCLVLAFKKTVPGGYLGPRSMTVRQEVLIPGSDAEADLRLLQAALSSRCPSAQVQLIA